ncbi:hypothetical protein QDT91_28550 (plasmid) [Mycolicibacterium aubagnense]|uniref:hypothetical protein n=1 Tax=Mycolicibacterium aubagnense TaxID=319707 RepID=UPI00244E0ABC|nr:hypothetical protein [Mycolicibacterium aubagnense]WGI35960.1 hypothetical protein QDT91_28550 [Mycolicibacterium aubagnense]
MAVLTCLLLLGWAWLVPAGHQRPWWLQLQWWHTVIVVVLVVLFVGSWHGLHLSTTVARWIPMAWRNRGLRRSGTSAAAGSGPQELEAAQPDPEGARLRAQIVIHLRPQPHAVCTAASREDEIPWDFITAWLNRYGVRADSVTVCSVTCTPPASGLRGEAAAALEGQDQQRDTWVTYALSAASNVDALKARGTVLGAVATADDQPEDARVQGPTALADTVTRRLVAELRERGWVATVCDPAAVPRFVEPGAGLRRECWTGAEYSDGFRAVYAVDPQRLKAVVSALPTLRAHTTWLSATIRSVGRQPTTIEACVGTLTTNRPPLRPMDGLVPVHGAHRQAVEALQVAGLSGLDCDRALVAQLAAVDLADLGWHSAASGVPIGRNRERQWVYLGLSSHESVRITITGTPQFHQLMMARLALSGLPIAMYTSTHNLWVPLIDHAGPQQIQLAPPVDALPAGAIVVSDEDSEAPVVSGPGAIAVSLRRPQAGAAPLTSVVITQNPQRLELFTIRTTNDPRGQMLHSQL